MTSRESPQLSEAPVLAVDLDGSLLRSDMLWETFWDVLARDWRSPFQVAMALRHGRAALKGHLSERAQVDVATLPYDPVVLAHVQTAREAGQRTALVTATDQTLADQIAAHLGCFDEVHGSDGTTNLKGAAKARFLTDRFGEAGFAYVGDSAADLHVWPHAAQAVTVAPSAAVKARLASVDVPVTELAVTTARAGDYLKALRPHQWLKNLLIFLPLLAGHQLAAVTLMQAVLAFVAFSAIASSVYVLNDLLDLKADRAHPRKCRRPFAAGLIPIAHGAVMAFGLLALGAGLALILGSGFAIVMAIYYTLTTLYSLKLKRLIVIDICVLAALYTIRIIAGGVATAVPLSFWLLAFALFLFFALAAVKRQAELVDMAARGEISGAGRGYHTDDLGFIAQAAVASGYVSVLVMALYISQPDVVQLYPRPEGLWAICLVLLFWLTRVGLLTHRGQMHDDPVVFAATDRVSLMCLGVIAAAVLVSAW